MSCMRPVSPPVQTCDGKVACQRVDATLAPGTLEVCHQIECVMLPAGCRPDAVRGSKTK
jgi:hypothetical protein